MFEAIVDPDKMCNYFISQSTGRMEEGKELTWRFPEFDMEVPVKVGKIINEKYISFYWENEGDDLFVEIKLEPTAGGTLVTITEKEKELDQKGLDWYSGNTYGWANFLACLKAFVEYGINLRKGAFDFMSTNAVKE